MAATRVAKLRAIASAFPAGVLGNEELARLFPGWTAEKIHTKTGISERRIAAPDETAADLAYAAALRLFEREDVDAGSIDFLLFCTQTADHRLPATCCSLQLRLGLRRDCGALDINIGCSGFVYGLALAKSLIETGLASRVLLLTADTYSKLVHPLDRSVRTLFGDAAAATLVDAVDAETALIGPFVFGTDGTGMERLIVPAGGMRRPASADTAVAAMDVGGNTRSPEQLFMDGAAIMEFSLAEVPKAVNRLLAQSGTTLEDFDSFVFHQASRLVLEALRRKLHLPVDKFVIHLEHCGNTIASSIPIALEQVMRNHPAPGRAMLVGYGVGYSWAATMIHYH